MKIDCHDQSDENYCWQIDIDESQYRKSVAPENPSSKEKLEIGVCFELLDIAEVNEPLVRYFSFLQIKRSNLVLDFLQMSFTLRFNIWLKWMDNRLHYQNLNNDHYQNVIPEDQASKLWKPILLFKNSNEGQILTYHSSSSDMLVVRNGVGKAAPPSHWDEGRLFNSSETEIL